MKRIVAEVLCNPLENKNVRKILWDFWVETMTGIVPLFTCFNNES